MTGQLTTVGYALAALAFLVLAARLLTGQRSQLHTVWLTVATVATTLWAVAIAFDGNAFTLTPYQVFVVELLHDGFWLFFLSMLLGGAVAYRGFPVVRFGGLLVVAVVFVVGTLAALNRPIGPFSPDLDRSLIYGSLLTALIALMGLEQIYRNARTSQRRGLKYLCLGVGTIFVFDLVLFSNAILSGQISDMLWAVRGVVVLMCAPLIGIAVRRGPAWLGGIFVSRQIVFFATMTMFAAVYLVVVVFAGYFLRIFGGAWGPAGQMIFFAAALLTLLVMLVSDQRRAKLRVYITKHFFESKYDYRAEWLRLIETLTAPDEELPLRKRAIKSLAQILGAPSGLLWLRPPGRHEYQCVAAWNATLGQEVLAEDHSLVSFMRRTGWIVDLREYSGDRDRYDRLRIDDQLAKRDDTALVVPLLHDGELLGFVFLAAPRTSGTLNFEDHDLLKTAGKQIASYLAQEMSTEQLAESRQFEAFNRLTAYLMHDLKNLIAQQSLVVENAKKHKDNPEFIDDAMATISGGVDRLRRVIEHIQQRSVSQPHQRTDLASLVAQAVSQCSDRQPRPKLVRAGKPIWVVADRERLSMAIYHGLRNAQEATASDGTVKIEVNEDGMYCNVTIEDSGVGMEEVFIHERLFRPFDSTKGTQGMGIGAYQMRETVRSMGGDVTVSSEPDVGTRLILRLLMAR